MYTPIKQGKPDRDQSSRIYSKPQRVLSLFFDLSLAIIISLAIALIASATIHHAYEQKFAGRVYPDVSIANIPFGGKTPEEIMAYWLDKNIPFAQASFTFEFEGRAVTISGASLNLGYDATLSATQAYLVGRSGKTLTDLFLHVTQQPVNLSPFFRWDEETVNDTITNLAQQIDIPAQDALFQFENGKVVTFKPSTNGRRVNTEEVKKRFRASLIGIPRYQKNQFNIPLIVEPVVPSFTTDKVNSFGIKDRIGVGFSQFHGSIPGRIHNVALAASRINGLLIKPGETFSFDQAVGDISAATGYQSAYIIKEGRTVLGDGGGVCQVSTTLFRAALSAGLPIVERRAHAYRVHYYEEGGFKPGIDATVFAPSVDLRIKNDTPGYILIQSKADTQNLALTIEFYGTSDGRKSEISNHIVWNEQPPPPDLYQDDPTLTKGVVKQVDFAAWGASASFKYKVTRGNDVLEDTIFNSNFRPWQAVYLRGTL